MSFIIKHPSGGYFLWSTITDLPVSYVMTRDELTEYVRLEEGRRGLEDLQERLSRADAKGTSSYADKNADETMWLNRAGIGETPLTREQILAYVAERGSKPPRGFKEPPGLPDDDPRGWTYERFVGGGS